MREHLPSKTRVVVAIGLVAMATLLLSLLRVDDAQLRRVTAAQATRAALSEIPAGKVRLELTGDPTYHDTVREIVGSAPKLTIDPAGALLKAGISEKLGIVTVSGDLKGEAKLANWSSLLPPIVAILLALVIRQIIPALFIAVWLGACLHNGADPFSGLWFALRDYLWGNLTDSFNGLIFLFTFSLVGMVSVVTRMGGTHGLVEAIAKTAKTRRSTQLATAGMGIAVFFDDYANTVVVGTTMRALTDRMKISREKLAYLVDSTAAPIAGIAVISTWIGYEVEQFDRVADFVGMEVGGYALFFQVLPYRFYCIFTLVTVGLICWLGRDFGPMLTAERRAVAGQPLREGSRLLVSKAISHMRPAEGVPLRWYNAVIPVGVVIVGTFGGMLWMGTQSSLFTGTGPDAVARSFSLLSFTDWKDAFIGVGEFDNGGPQVLSGAAVAGSLLAIAMAIGQGILPVKESLTAWLGGARIMILANTVLLMAWAIRSVCGDVGTSLYLTAALYGVVSAVALPLLVFCLAAVVAFSTGTSWGTMGILLPTVGPMAFAFGDPMILILCLGAVLDGAIFGDHCSPLSDTTVLSSISSAVDHVDHVRTQIPYALLSMVAAGLCGYLLCAAGGPVWAAYLLGVTLITTTILILGRRADAPAPT